MYRPAHRRTQVESAWDIAGAHIEGAEKKYIQEALRKQAQANMQDIAALVAHERPRHTQK